MIISLIRSGYPLPIIFVLVLAIVISATFSIVMHEISHGYVALWCGDPTAKNAGRLTINPLKHFDYVGLIVMLLIGFGWAKPVPINPRNFKKQKLGIVLVSLAGVTTNLCLVGINLLLMFLLYPFLQSLMIVPTGLRILGFFLYYLISDMVVMNMMLAFFNILPIAPLDGFNFLNALLPYGNGFSRFMFKYGWIVLLGIILVSNIFDFVGLPQYDIFYLVQQLAWRLIALVQGG